MTYTITAFSANVSPTGPQLDNNFNAMALQSVSPCTVTGTNTLTLTKKTNTFTISAYDQNMQISGVASATNAAATTARYGALSFLKVYRDSPAGPVQCSGGEIVVDCAFTLMYDAALDSGNGGWHLFSTTAANGAYLPLTGGTLTGPLLVTSTVGTTNLTSTIVQSGTVSAAAALMVGTSAATITRMLSALATLTFTVTPANSTQDQNMTVPGAAVNDGVMIGGPTSVLAGISYFGFVPAAGTVTVRRANVTAASIAAVTQTFRAVLMGTG